jgi:hypothetical protein
VLERSLLIVSLSPTNLKCMMILHLPRISHKPHFTVLAKKIAVHDDFLVNRNKFCEWQSPVYHLSDAKLHKLSLPFVLHITMSGVVKHLLHVATCRLVSLVSSICFWVSVRFSLLLTPTNLSQHISKIMTSKFIRRVFHIIHRVNKAASLPLCQCRT